jgi:hypothetical protein
MIILNKLSSYFKDEQPPKKALAELNNIMMATNSTSQRLVKGLTKKQKEIFIAFDALEELNMRIK